MDKKLPNTTVDIHLIEGLNDLAVSGNPAMFLNGRTVSIPSESGLKMKNHTLNRLVEHGWLEVRQDGRIVATENGLADMQKTNDLQTLKDDAPDYLKIVNQDDGLQSVYCSRCDHDNTEDVVGPVDGKLIWTSQEDDDFKAGAVAAARHYIEIHQNA